jgi:hypothetical protein
MSYGNSVAIGGRADNGGASSATSQDRVRYERRCRLRASARARRERPLPRRHRSRARARARRGGPLSRPRRFVRRRANSARNSFISCSVTSSPSRWSSDSRDAMLKKHLTFIFTTRGKPRSKVGLGNDFRKWAREAGLPDYCRLYGLKKAGMRRRAEAGNTTHELMAFSGHKSMSMVELYTKAADKKRLAESGAAKMRSAQNTNTGYTNIASELHKHTQKRLKTKD